MEPSSTQPGRPPRPVVGLDKPCRKCGRPIYFRYKGPVEGLCGRCTDTTRGKARPLPRNSRRIGFFRRGPRAAASAAAFYLVLLGLLVYAGYLVYRYLL